MSFTRCVIVAGAPDCAPFSPAPGDYIMACDHGYDHALALGIRPHLVLGDFDSIVTSRDPSIPVLQVPAEKDDTDTYLAVRHGLSLGFSEFVLLGATGGRPDHFWANCAAAAFLARQGAACQLLDRAFTLYALANGTLTLHGAPGGFVSVLAYTDLAQGVTLAGMKYPLQNATIHNTFPIGTSNEFASETATVSVSEGTVLVFVIHPEGRNPA